MPKRLFLTVVALAFCGVVGMGAAPSELLIQCETGRGNQFRYVELPEGVWMARMTIGFFERAWWDQAVGPLEVGATFHDSVAGNSVGVRVNLIPYTGRYQTIKLLDRTMTFDMAPVRFELDVIPRNGKKDAVMLSGKGDNHNHLSDGLSPYTFSALARAPERTY